jgi:hypothetical protein
VVQCWEIVINFWRHWTGAVVHELILGGLLQLLLVGATLHLHLLFDGQVEQRRSYQQTQTMLFNANRQINENSRGEIDPSRGGDEAKIF